MLGPCKNCGGNLSTKPSAPSAPAKPKLVSHSKPNPYAKKK